MHVDQLNVREVLMQIVSAYRIGAVTFDQYDSAELVQLLEVKKVASENEAWSNPFQHRIYRGARSAFYNDLVTLPDTPTITSDDSRAPGAIYELVRVEEIEGHKIDHPENGSKDLADALVRVIEHVTGQAKLAFSFGAIKPDQPPHSGFVPSTAPRVDPSRPPSPVTTQLRAADEQRKTERPTGELETATGRVIPPNGFSFGSTRR